MATVKKAYPPVVTRAVDCAAYNEQPIEAEVKQLNADGYRVTSAVPMMVSYFADCPKRYETRRVLLIAERKR